MFFKAHKNGKQVTINYNLRPITRSTISDPIPINLIYGVDTESLMDKQDNLHTVAIPFYNGFQEECLTFEQIKKYDSPFLAFLETVFSRHALPETGDIKPAWTKIRGESGKRRPGRHKLPFILTVWYNLEYDIARLFSPESPFWRGVKTGHDGFKIFLDPFELEIRHHLLYGSAPHFSYIFRHDGYILEMKAVDMWGYWKAGLDKTAKSLGLEGKIEIESEMFDRKIEDMSAEDWEQLYKYAKYDPVVTRGIYLQTADLLSSISQAVFSRGILPPSAPKAAAKICFGNLENSQLKPAPVDAIQHALNGYHGGYVYALYRGYLKNITVIDRKSAYPTILKLLPNPETVKYHPIKKGTIFESLIGLHGFVVASFLETNTKYPCVSLFGDDGRTMHPWGNFDRVTISIAELAVGVLMGSVSNVVVHGGFYITGEKGGIFFNFIERVYDLKNNSESKSPMYQVAKLLMNSLYGKLIEIHDLKVPLFYDSDYDLIVPDNDNKEYKERLLSAYANENWSEFDSVCLEYKNGKGTTFGKYLSSDVCSVGSYFSPVYASLVTALQRSWVVLLSRSLESVAGDTDSIFTLMDNSSNVFNARIVKADIIARQIGIGRVQEGEELGDYEVELKNASGYLSGIKQYFFEAPDGKPKCAHHTLVKPSPESIQKYTGFDPETIKHLPKKEQSEIIKQKTLEFYKVAIQTLSRGLPFAYVGASSPVKLKTALSRGKDFGVFEKRERVINPKYDDRLCEIGIGQFEWKPVDEIRELLEG